ncbi:hypothetical protein [Paenibacillus sp. Soil522]|uniref:hypothetical protein n=1 Tax=Paenibacillus sp. Soil522 TaxID=1736388 RepID=UPI0006FDA3F2|nr:hypothetical protein [Paenibacillus sp. Soil522]KRE29656.1 hypothetical protein ASG81_25485 [Paenibacillus sp. Soil522]
MKKTIANTYINECKKRYVKLTFEINEARSNLCNKKNIKSEYMDDYINFKIIPCKDFDFKDLKELIDEIQEEIIALENCMTKLILSKAELWAELVSLGISERDIMDILDAKLDHISNERMEDEK